MSDSQNQPPYGQDPNQPPYGPPPGQYPPPGGYYAPAPMPEREARGWASAAHWAPLALTVLSAGLLAILAPLVIWLMHRQRSWLVDVNAKEALNFQITLVIAYVAGAILTVVIVGIFILLAALVCSFVFGIQGAMAASRGEAYRYPISIRFVK